MCQEEKGDEQRKRYVDRCQGGVSWLLCCLYSKIDTVKRAEPVEQAWVGILEKLTESVLWMAMWRGALGSGYHLAWLQFPSSPSVVCSPSFHTESNVRRHVYQSHPAPFSSLAPPAESKSTAQPHRRKW